MEVSRNVLFTLSPPVVSKPGNEHWYNHIASLDFHSFKSTHVYVVLRNFTNTQIHVWIHCHDQAA